MLTSPSWIPYLLFLLALLPRAAILGLNTPFWFDEDWTEETGLLPLGPMFRRVVEEDFHPLLGYLVLGSWARLLHALHIEAEAFYRLLPALLGAYASVVLYRLLTRFLPPGNAFLGSLAFALIPQGILQDTEFRQYALAKLALTLALEGALTNRPWAFALHSALAFHLHYLAGALALTLLPVQKKAFGKHLLLFLGLILPWVPVPLGQVQRLKEIAFWVGKPEDNLMGMVSLLIYNQEPALLFLGVLYLLSAFLGLLLSPLRVSLPLVLFLGAFLFAVGFQPLSPRYLFLLLPFLGYGASWLLRVEAVRSPNAVWAGMLLLAAVAAGWVWCFPWIQLTAWSMPWQSPRP